MIGEVKWERELCFKPEKQSRMGALKRCARTPKKQGAHYSLSLKKFGIIILFRTRLWISKKWESFLEMWGCPTVPVQRVIYTSNVCLWKHIEKLGLCSFRKQDPAGSKGSQENLAWVCTLISSPRSKGRGWWTLSLRCKQQQCCEDVALASLITVLHTVFNCPQTECLRDID